MSEPHIVVVGASAGGVEALGTLVAGLPPTFPAAVFVVLHVPSHTPSQLHAILSNTTSLPVTPGEDGEEIVPGHVYVASSDRHLLVERDRLRVTRGPKENRSRPAVDVLFRSAAYAYGPQAIGIVLTGLLDDGTAGLWAIKDRGGVAIVQSPEDAQYPSMPESALQHVAVDHSVPVAAMPALLTGLLTEARASGAKPKENEKMRIESRIALEGNALQGGVMKLGDVSPNTCPECHGVLVRIEEGGIVRYRCHTGHAFSLLTLLADVNDEIDKMLWGALRAIEERILLLREMEQVAIARNDTTSAQGFGGQAQATEEQVQPIREMVLGHALFGRVSAGGRHRK